jgi:hypothetical protein
MPGDTRYVRESRNETSAQCPAALNRMGRGVEAAGTRRMCMNCGAEIVKREGRWVHAEDEEA